LDVGVRGEWTTRDFGRLAAYGSNCAPFHEQLTTMESIIEPVRSEQQPDFF
jgi:hypothetical protein